MTWENKKDSPKRKSLPWWAFLSYVFGWPLKSYTSVYNGKVETWVVNGRKVLNTTHANYSFDSLHRVFQKAFHTIHIKELNPSATLLLGLGGGSVPEILHKELQLDTRITAVEIDPLMIRIAAEEFGVVSHQNLSIIQQDAMDFIRNCQELFDLIVIDLFIDDRVPELFTTPDFILQVIAVAGKKGMVLMNFIVKEESDQRRMETIMEAFRTSCLVSALTIDRYNTVIIARKY